MNAPEYPGHADFLGHRGSALSMSFVGIVCRSRGVGRISRNKSINLQNIVLTFRDDFL